MRNHIVTTVFGACFTGLFAFAGLAQAKTMSKPEQFEMALKETTYMLNSLPTIAHQAYFLDQNVSGPSVLEQLRKLSEEKSVDKNVFQPVRFKAAGKGAYVLTHPKIQPVTFAYLQTPLPGRTFDLKVNGKTINLHMSMTGQLEQEDEEKLNAFLAKTIVLIEPKSGAKSTAMFLIELLIPRAHAAGGGWAGFLYGVVTKIFGNPLNAVDNLDELCHKINIARNNCDQAKAQLQMDSQSFWAGTNTDMYKAAEYVNHTNKMAIEYNNISGKMLDSLYISGFCAVINQPILQNAGEAVVDWTGDTVSDAMKQVHMDPHVLTPLCRENLGKLTSCMDVIIKKGAERYHAKKDVKIRDKNCPVLNYYSVELEHDNDLFPDNKDQADHTQGMAQTFMKMTKGANNNLLLNNPNGMLPQPGTPNTNQ